MRVPAPLRVVEFRSVWLAGLVSDTGDWLLLIALPVVVYSLTGSALGTSLAFIVELAPGILLAPLAGWCADRFDRRRLLVAVSLTQAAALLPLFAVQTRADLPILYAVILAESTLLTVFDPAKNALLPTLVSSHDLVAANSLVGLGQNLARLVGGPLGGVLLAAGGLPVVAGADLITYILAAMFIGADRGGRRREPDIAGMRQGRVPDRQDGSYRSIVANSRVRETLLITLVTQIAQGIFVVLFVVFVIQRLGGGSADVGLLRGVQAIGAIAGGLVLTTLARRWQPVNLTAVACVAFGLLELALWYAPAFSTATVIYLGFFIAIGVPGIVLATGLISSLQTDAGSHEHGRAFSAYGLVSNAGQLLGMLAAGLLTAPLGLLSVLNLQAFLYLGAGAFAFRQIARRARDKRTVQQHAAPASRADRPTPRH